MTNKTLAHDYFKRARVRLKVLALLQSQGAHADVIREAQEAVELILKGYLRLRLIDPPKWHDMAPILRENTARLSPRVQAELERICSISTQLKKERELSFYGDD